MSLSIIKYSLIGAMLSVVVFIMGYMGHMAAFTLVAYGLMFAFLIVAGFLAIKEIYKNHKAEALTKEDHSKVWKLLFVSLFLLADFEFLLYFLDYQGVISDLATTNYVLSKVVYAVLCIGTGISGALLMKAGVLEYCGSTRYAQLNWTVRAAFLLLWLTVWSTIHF